MINNACRECFFKLSKLQNICHFCLFDTKIMLVKSFIISRLDYCNILYSCATINLLNKLKKVLNACLRFLFNTPSYSGTSLLLYLQQCHMLPIEFRIKCKLCLTVFKILNNIAPIYLHSLFYIYVLLHGNLRSSSDCRKIIDVRNSSISFKMCTMRNKLPKN